MGTIRVKNLDTYTRNLIIEVLVDDGVSLSTAETIAGVNLETACAQLSSLVMAEVNNFDFWGGDLNAFSYAEGLNTALPTMKSWISTNLTP